MVAGSLNVEGNIESSSGLILSLYNTIMRALSIETFLGLNQVEVLIVKNTLVILLSDAYRSLISKVTIRHYGTMGPQKVPQ